MRSQSLFYMEQNCNQIISCREAGARGGAKTMARYGKAHFQSIGEKGQATLASRITSEQRRAWGAMGGRPKRRRLNDMGTKEAKS